MSTLAWLSLDATPTRRFAAGAQLGVDGYGSNAPATEAVPIQTYGRNFGGVAAGRPRDSSGQMRPVSSPFVRANKVVERLRGPALAVAH